MDSPSKTSRKVRFTLPEHENNFATFIKSRNSPAVRIKNKPAFPPVAVDDTKVHGTSRYINGTLNFGQDDFKSLAEDNKQKIVPKTENKTVEPKHLRPCIKPPRKSREVKRTTVEIETSSTTKSLPLQSSLSKKFHCFIRSRSESRGRKKEISERNRKSSTVCSHAEFYFPDNISKTDSMPTKPSRRKPISHQKTSDILTVPPLSTPIALIDTMPIPVNDIDVLPNVLNMNLNDNANDCESVPQISIKIQELPHMNQMVNNDENFRNFIQFFDRWRQLQSDASRAISIMELNEFQINCGGTSTKLVHKKLPDGKRWVHRSCKIDTVPQVGNSLRNSPKSFNMSSVFYASKAVPIFRNLILKNSIKFLKN